MSGIVAGCVYDATARRVEAAVKDAMHERLALTIPAQAAPHVDEDRVTASRLSTLSVDY